VDRSASSNADMVLGNLLDCMGCWRRFVVVDSIPPLWRLVVGSNSLDLGTACVEKSATKNAALGNAVFGRSSDSASRFVLAADVCRRSMSAVGELLVRQVWPRAATIRADGCHWVRAPCT
jgi:hypothetical protein